MSAQNVKPLLETKLIGRSWYPDICWVNSYCRSVGALCDFPKTQSAFQCWLLSRLIFRFDDLRLTGHVTPYFTPDAPYIHNNQWPHSLRGRHWLGSADATAQLSPRRPTHTHTHKQAECYCFSNESSFSEHERGCGEETDLVNFSLKSSELHRRWKHGINQVLVW